ncbi:MAG: acyl-CoA dehydratase activase [Deltaproteobacteria bacterium]|nr:acyl-CoA dehydratase activase [Deltaproteobacteria bacterium]
MKSLGICIGASTLSAVGITRDKDGQIHKTSINVRPHHGNPREALLETLINLGVDGYDRIAVTGRKFRHAVNLSSISEPEAVESALFHLNGNGQNLDAVISAGGETFMVYVMGKDGRICSVQTGNKCASGTGEFFVQQLNRIGISVSEAIHHADEERPYKVSGRCSVFCKSDCTHATNKGVHKGKIVAGLCKMMAGKIIEIIKQIPRNDIMIIGGTAQNPVMVSYLQKEIKNLIVPEEAPYFEALGSALWALDHETVKLPEKKRLFKKGGNSFSILPPLNSALGMVDFKTAERGVAQENDRCVIGLDVGSTTTKAVILRLQDDKVLASVYLRTKGNPVQASRECYADLYAQLGELGEEIKIVGLGVTGSGRQIAALHAMTGGIINEIIAHATGALFFDQTVDTIFEIGGQDAKYTYIKNGVPSDYAMNDACSAGTGSFLEEAAKETMGIEMEDIGSIAIQGQNPPNFNDQCAAFISSDIKNASHEGMTREDIVAGLVYSICMNYDNRVKGNRPVGDNIFMQGGVCYNKAVPVAMAALTGKRIVVPPESGLMGAFGVALEIKGMLQLNLLREKDFSLKTLRDRTIAYGEPFICNGGKEKCDRKCEVARIVIEGTIYPFGGACNRWYNQRFNIHVDTENLNLVKMHDNLTFNKYIPQPEELGVKEISKTIGINKSFLVNTYYPLYYHFFSRIGLRVLISDLSEQEGVDRQRAPFCYPAEISHGYLQNLLKKKPDYLFLPQLKGDYAENGDRKGITCPLSQGEPYYLSSAFKDMEIFGKLKEEGKIIMPVIDFSGGYEAAEDAFISTARKLGCRKNAARKAFSEAVKVQTGIHKEMKEAGLRFLRELEEDPDRTAVVILGRSYNAFVPEANMGIPHKFASRGVPVIPFDFLPLEKEPVNDNMYWSTGQSILKGATFIEKHPQLFGCYITNFSCGPDSFLVGYFRTIMGKKPFLILELDSHVADAGLETRIEAFMDIIKNYRELGKREQHRRVTHYSSPKAAHFDYRKQEFIDSKGRGYPFHHPRTHLIIPSMGRFLNDATSAVFRSIGIRASVLPPADDQVLKLGRGNTTCKECLPLLLTVGSLLKYLKQRGDSDELLVYFMPTASGPCRFGQYSPFISQLIARNEIEDVAVFSPQAENSYTELGGNEFTLKLWSCLVIADIMQDIYSILLTNAVDKDLALEIYNKESKRIIEVFEHSPNFRDLQKTLKTVAKNFQKIPVKRHVNETPTILLTGEIFVRHDDISRQFLVEKLAQQGFATKVSSVMEWIYYTDWCFEKGLSADMPNFQKRVSLFLRATWMRRYEKTYKKIMVQSDLFQYRLENVDHLISNIQHLINPELTGEAVLTVGAAITEIFYQYCGVIAIGPFGCMPNRLSEAILSREMGTELPFLAIESDGNLFPQIITAKLEVFILQALRLQRKMMYSNRKSTH